MRKASVLCAAMLILGSTMTVLAEDADTTPSQTDKPAATDMDHSQMDHSKMEMMGKKEATGTGVVNAVDIDKSSINITHEPMPDFGWPKMTMDLPATRKVDLSKVKAGDKVTFTLKLGMDKKYRVIDVKPAP